MRLFRPRRAVATLGRRHRRTFAAAVLLLPLAAALAACNSDKSTGGSGPVTLAFKTPVYAKTDVSSRDTVYARVSVDGAAPIVVPRDSVVGISRGDHTLDVWYDISYLPQHYTVKVNPSGNVQTETLHPEGSCRDFDYDSAFCVESGVAVNELYWSKHQRVYCAASDFGDFCSRFPADLGNVSGLANAWPAPAPDQYLSEGKLLVAATLGADAGGSAAGARMAMSLYDPGDYSPHVRLTPVSGDSSRYFNEVWTDARHLPIFPATSGTLGDLDRPGQNFGLSVKITYAIPQDRPDVVLVRYDLTNISATDSFRFVHPEEPAGGHTLQNVYLAPFLDPNIGVSINSAVPGQAEVIDDNATVFPQDSLVAAYDQAFAVPTFSTAAGGQTRPGLVGLRLVQGPAGTTARALLLDSDNVLSYATPALELTTYQYLTGGRGSAGMPAGCTAVGGSGNVDALLCSSETPGDVRVGWSVGPVASLAPGQSTSLTVALLFASPVDGTFTTGTQVAPDNSALASTTRQIYDIAGALRSLGATLAGATVTPGR